MSATNDEDLPTTVLVNVEPVESTGRYISSTPDVAQLLSSRAADIRSAIAAGASTVHDGIAALSAPDGWGVASVEAKFGITLGVEGSVLISKASASTTFEITVSFAPTT